MIELREYFATFIENPLMLDVVLGVLVIVLASVILRALGIDFFNERK